MDNLPKKRGRKPNILKNKKFSIQNYEKKETPLIVHLPITIESDTISENNNIYLDSNNVIENNIIDSLKNEIKELKNKLKNKNNKSMVYQVKINDGLPCWWCRYSYNSPKVELPFKYQNDKFFTFGNFCSYECCEAYNIDLNDENVTKRSSLLKYQYYKTYNEFKNIKKAQDWKLLKGNGGCIEIEDFRDNFTKNNDDYIYIKPPMVSRYANIEKIDINVIKESNTEQIVLKRSKPLKTNKIGLNSFVKLSN